MRTRRSVYLAYLHTLAFAVLTIGVILLVFRPQYAGHAAHASASVPIIAGLSLLLGGMLLAALYQSSMLTIALGIPVGLVVVFSLLAQFPATLAVMNHFGLSSLQYIPPALSLTVALFVLSLRMHGGKSAGSLLARGPAAIAMTIGVLSLMTTLPETEIMRAAPGWDQLMDHMRLAHEVEVTFNTSILVILFGTGCMLLGSEVLALPVRLDRGTLALGCLGTVITCLGWHFMHMHNLETARDQSDVMLASARQMIEQQRLAHIDLIHRIAERWQINEQIPSGALWRHETASYLRDFPDIALIGVLDQALFPTRAAARDPLGQADLQRVLGNAESRAWLAHVLASGEGHLSPVFFEGTPFAMIATPIPLPGRPDRLAVALLDIETMIRRHIKPGLSNYIVRVEEQGRLLYASSPLAPGSLILAGETVSRFHHDTVWRLAVYMNRQGALLRSAFLPPMLLLFGLGLTVLLMISQRLAWESNKRNRQLDAANVELSRSLLEQSRLRDANQRIMEFSKDLLCAFDSHGRWLQVNPACRTILGYEPAELIGRPFEEQILASDIGATTAAARDAKRRGGQAVDFRNRFRRTDGITAHLLWSATWSEDEQALFCVAHDITALVAIENRERDRQRILSMISTDQPLPEILDAVCLLGESRQDNTRCSLRVLDHERKHLLKGAAPNLPRAYTAAMDGLEISKQSSLIQRMTTHQGVLISANIATDPIWCVPVPGRPATTTYAQLADVHGLRACWGVPVISPSGETLGTLATYRDQIGPPTDAELDFAWTCSQLAAIALDRHRDRRQLVESEQRYRSLFTYNPDPVYSMDPDGIFKSFNHAAAGLLGYTSADVLGKHFAVALVPEDRPKVREHFSAALSGMAQHYQTRCQARDGATIDLEVTNLPVVVGGEVVGVFGIAKNITDRNRMIRALRERDQFFQLSLDMYFTLDSHGAFLQTNPAFDHTLNVSEGSLVGTPYTDLISGKDKDKVRRAVLRLLAGQQVHDLEIQAVGRDGSPRWIELNATADGGIIFCAARDITDRKATERKLQSTLSELAASNEELEKFAFVASHDLQEPLRKIQAFGERLQSRATGLDEQGRDYLQRMGSAAHRMQTLIRDLLAYSRVSTRQEPFVQLDMNRIVTEVLGDLETALRDGGVEVIRGELPETVGDATQIRQVVQNLLSNAIKFRQMEVRPLIRVYAESLTAEAWTLCVSDNGIGFDEKYLDRIFDPFQRLHSRQAYPGTGIGLAIVAKVLERHDAAISAESTPGLGTTFRVRFTRV